MKPQSISELNKLLINLNIQIPLDPAPREYLAVLTETGKPETISLKFRTSPAGEIPGPEDVISNLIKTHLGKEVDHAEITSSTLEYAIQEMEKNHDNYSNRLSLTVPGDKIRYTKKGEKRNQTWAYLPNSVKIHILPSEPHKIDDDPLTLKVNLSRAYDAIQDAITGTDEEIETIRKRKTKLEETLGNLK